MCVTPRTMKYASSGACGCECAGPNGGLVTECNDTRPGTVNSGCPQSVSKKATAGQLLRRWLRSSRQKVDLPAPLAPATATTSGLPQATPSTRRMMGCQQCKQLEYRYWVRFHAGDCTSVLWPTCCQDSGTRSAVGAAGVPVL
jgi:hypothetical protein